MVTAQYYRNEPSVNPSVKWWYVAKNVCDNFFKVSAHFDSTANPQQIELVINELQSILTRFEQMPFNKDVEKARTILLDTMDAVLHAYYATLHYEDSRAARFMAMARFGLANFEDMLAEIAG